MLRRWVHAVVSEGGHTFLPDVTHALCLKCETKVLSKPSVRTLRFSCLSRHVPRPVLPPPLTKTAREQPPWRRLRSRWFGYLAGASFYGGLRSIARRFRTQALESYCLWHGPLLKSLYGSFWPAERWLLVTGVLRNSGSWVPSFAVGLMRPERWLWVAIVTSFNTVGAHIPRLSLLLLAQLLATAGNAETLSRDAYIPLGVSSPSPASLQTSTSPVMAGLLQMWQELCIWGRLCTLILYFLPLFLTYPLTSLDATLWRLWLRSLRHTLETCGPAFIKWGQWASTRRDLFAPEVAQELRKLQMNSPAHPGELSKRAIESAFGLPVDALFDDFEVNPLASGSIGQVHKAKLSAVGSTVTGIKADTPVAIKVRHPNVDIAFQRDMRLMLWIARCVDQSAVLKGFNMQEMICQFARPMSEQVDLCVEAANLQCFRHNFRRNARVLFPEPLFPLVTSDILVETFHTGVTVQDIVDDADFRDTSLAELGSAAFFDMVVQHNLLHADLHPGNILVDYSPSKTKLHQWIESISDRSSHLLPSKTANPFPYLLSKLPSTNEIRPRIILLDAGMATQLTDKERYHMLGLFRSVAEMDGKAAAEHTLSFSGTHQTCPDPDGFRSKMERHFDVIRQPTWSDSDFSSSVDAFGHVIDIIRQCRVALPGQIVSCLFTVFLLEGWSSKIDPEHSLMLQIRTLLKKVDWSLERRIREGANKVLIDGLSNLNFAVAVD